MRPFIPAAALAASLAVPSYAARVPGLMLDLGWDRALRSSQRLPDRALEESRTPGLTTVLDRRRIEESGARTLQELLAGELGVNVFDETGNRHQRTLELRGFNNTPVPAVALVVDGVRVNEPDLGQTSFHLIPLETVERVELHPGPGTLYGKDALAGVLYVTTREPAQDAVRGELATELGSFDRKKAAGSASGTRGALGYFVSASKENDHGYRESSDADVNAALVKLRWRAGERARTTASYARVDDRLEQPGSLTGAELATGERRHVSAVRARGRLDFLTLEHRLALPLGFSAAGNAHLRRRREATPSNRGRSSLSESLAGMEQKGFTGQLSHEGSLLDRRSLLAVGFEAARGDADSQSRGTFGGFPFASGRVARTDATAVFAQETLDLWPERLILTAGLRYDAARTAYRDPLAPANDGSQAFNRSSPRVGLNWNPREDLRLHAVYAEAFRVPTVLEISSLGPFGRGDLRPVKARNVELGFKARLAGPVELRGALFRTELRDEIYFDPTQGLFGRNINLDRSRREGVEWGLKADAGTVEGFLNHAYTRASFQTPLALSGVPFPATQSVADGDRLPTVPEHMLSLGLGWRPLEGALLSWSGRCRGSQYLVGDEENARARMPSWCTLDLGASYDAGAWRLFVAGRNLTDKKHQTRGILAADPATGAAERFLVPGEGASVTAGVAFRFSAGGAAPAAEARAPNALTALARELAR